MIPKTVLVTGCAGFIGSNFVNAFLEKFPKTRIIGLDNLATGRKDAVSKKITFYKGSIADEKILDKIFQKHRPEFVFHFAALPRVAYSVQFPAKTAHTNVYGTWLLLEKSCKNNVQRFIFSSSSSVYGEVKQLPTKEKDNAPKPVSPYALQKHIGEQLCLNASSLYGLDTVNLRYFNVFGPGQYGDSAYSTVISAWLECLYGFKKQKPFLESDGKQSRDFCYIDNVIQANIKAMNFGKKFKGEVFNIAHGERTDLLTVKNLIEKYTGKKLLLAKRPPRVGDIRHTHASITKARQFFGYKPTINFADGLKKTIKWFSARQP